MINDLINFKIKINELIHLKTINVIYDKKIINHNFYYNDKYINIVIFNDNMKFFIYDINNIKYKDDIIYNKVPIFKFELYFDEKFYNIDNDLIKYLNKLPTQDMYYSEYRGFKITWNDIVQNRKYKIKKLLLGAV